LIICDKSLIITGLISLRKLKKHRKQLKNCFFIRKTGIGGFEIWIMIRASEKNDRKRFLKRAKLLSGKEI